MNRRLFLTTSSAALITLSAPSFAATTLTYTPGLVEEALANGETVMLRFGAEWCSTCARQERVIGALRSQNPAYNAITFIDIDWDKFGRSDLARDLNVPRRSTLILLKGDQELDRIVAGTSKNRIQELLDTGLAAST